MENNRNNVTEFVLLGLSSNRNMQRFCFGLFLSCCIAILLGNFFILITVSGIPLFKQPIYFFLFHLSFMDICYTSTVTPRLVQDLLSEKKAISFDDCIMQLFDMHFFGSIEVFILEGMAYDRYVVISKPLSYMIIMNQQRCNTMVAIYWGAGFLHSMTQLLLAISLPFCGPNEIDHYFFDVYPLLDLACTDTHLIGSLISVDSSAFVQVEQGLRAGM
ncbi:olfactory receptor 4P4-like [Tachyglossus aculeatus]|uniref:olfactory receptor 4P4-like n=1 Tax=Tachyglossus aculeatus TaxID=9261 RepID=UPI0018F7026C|nr:olfactory receptor 4P4-like [Tachyglossus aculeatus]